MAHVFIVDEKTIKVHLKYLFAGTGAKDYDCNFLFDSNVEIKPTVERLLSGMVADISRIRKGDNILFYLQQSSKHEGMFFGSFKAVSEPFLCTDNYLEPKLEKHLTFRVLIEPDEVYQKGITERDCLDSLAGISHPSEMCWSLIYRKLKANRGCTMITDYEYESIMAKIRNINTKPISNNSLDYDPSNYEICSSSEKEEYKGKMKSLDIKNRLLYKQSRNNSYESHLQAYILQNLENIPTLPVIDSPITWIGNEVSCGVGMQSIDVAFIQETKNEAHFIICELKDEQPIEYIKKQIEKYVQWMKEYIIPTYDKKVVIHPTIVAPKPKERTLEMFNSIKESTIFRSSILDINEIRYIGFTIKDKNITFEEVTDEETGI